MTSQFKAHIANFRGSVSFLFLHLNKSASPSYFRFSQKVGSPARTRMARTRYLLYVVVPRMSRLSCPFFARLTQFTRVRASPRRAAFDDISSHLSSLISSRPSLTLFPLHRFSNNLHRRQFLFFPCYHKSFPFCTHVRFDSVTLFLVCHSLLRFSAPFRSVSFRFVSFRFIPHCNYTSRSGACTGHQ